MQVAQNAEKYISTIYRTHPTTGKSNFIRFFADDEMWDDYQLTGSVRLAFPHLSEADHFFLETGIPQSEQSS